MVTRVSSFMRSALALVGGSILLTACPDEPVVPSDTDPSTGGTTVGETGGDCTPGMSQSCMCPNGSDGMRVCELSGQFGDCVCDGDTLDDSTTGGGTDDTTTTTTTGEDDTTTTGPQPCSGDAECADQAMTDCEVGVCGKDGMCTTEPLAFDTPCGSPMADECTTADTCDGDGLCQANDVDDGLGCSTCASGQCTCSAGSCGECNVFAPTNNFITTRSIEGWELTGSWGLHRQTPSTEVAHPSVFPGQVLGTNGNRVAPFPGSEIETSYARTRPFPLPVDIVFLSWNVDEGGGVSDNKTVRVSVDDGATWDTLVDCSVDPAWAMCQPNMDQDPGVFSLVQIPVPVALQGMEGIVEFGYDSGDACCNFEKGWYIDSLNLATECVCQENIDCDSFTDACGTGFCAVSGECALMPMPAETVCGDPFANDCNGADTCDGVGYCNGNESSNGLSLCGDCPGGGVCAFCDVGQCIDCISFSDFGDFNDPSSVADWVVTPITGTADWRLYDEAPINENPGSLPVVFPNAPVFGTDGNRDAPYPGLGEDEHSQVVTSEGLVPMTLTFISWNVDEGGLSYDNKIIEISVDGGASWTELVHCEAGLDSGQPFCQYVDDGRAADAWDPISIDTSAWAGMTGQLRFTYDTQDSCCSFERGWYIDDLNAFSTSCDDEPFLP